MTQKIHLVFKTHLDVGFTDFAAVVLENYFKKYIPSALRVAHEMRTSGRPERFIWTTGSFLIYEFLEQANSVQRRVMEDAIAAGDIAWHALPFTTHTELMDESLFEFGLTLSAELDARFGKHTIAAKMTDVPGHTRAAAKLLAQAGVQFLHIGVNPGSTVPQVPPLFRWQTPEGYELVVMYESGYGSAFQIEGIEDCLAFGHTSDNLGPQSAEQVYDVYADVRKQFPQAQVFASTLDAFAVQLSPVRSSLPLVTGEIGDTWIHGVGSDPIKVSQFKELSRLREHWLEEFPTLAADARFKKFSRRLLMVPEHTWGMDEKTFLSDYENYSHPDFNAARGRPNFQKFQQSWMEKRAYPLEAVLALADLPQGGEARRALEALRPVPPDLKKWKEFQSDGKVRKFTGWSAAFDPEKGCLTTLCPPGKSKNWADKDHQLGWLRYQTFSSQDYDRFLDQYILPAQRASGWAVEDFSKPGLEKMHLFHSQFWQPRVKDSYSRKEAQRVCYLFHLQAEPISGEAFGCPQDFWLEYRFNTLQPEMQVELQWFHKPACRMPEALWFSFIPCITPGTAWKIDKMGSEISPQEVVPAGNRHLHASGRYILWQDSGHNLSVTSLDAPLAAPGEPSLLNFNNDQPEIEKGMHFNLYNNIWGTNFPMWFEEDCRFRFTIIFSENP